MGSGTSSSCSAMSRSSFFCPSLTSSASRRDYLSSEIRGWGRFKTDYFCLRLPIEECPSFRDWWPVPRRRWWRYFCYPSQCLEWCKICGYLWEVSFMCGLINTGTFCLLSSTSTRTPSTSSSTSTAIFPSFIPASRSSASWCSWFAPRWVSRGTYEEFVMNFI